MDFFALFGLPVRYAVDGALLTDRFQALQRQFHPDGYATRPQEERLLASRQAATLNEAYQALRHPLRRAEYLLSLHGINIADEQYTLRDNAFLMEQLALREELEAIGDLADAESALDAFSQRLRRMTALRCAGLAERLDNGDWMSAADDVRKWRFLDKLRQQAEQLEDSLLDR